MQDAKDAIAPMLEDETVIIRADDRMKLGADHVKLADQSDLFVALGLLHITREAIEVA